MFKGWQWDLQHTLLTIGSPMAGALVTYLSQKDPGSIVEALSSWQSAKPLLFGAAVAELTTLLALAKQSFLPQPAAKENGK